MTKNIIFCADGTWNGPGEYQEYQTQTITTHTNIFKFFANIDGVNDIKSQNLSNEQEKSLENTNGEILQVAKYIHGVGDSKNIINKLFGGAFGSGVIKRIVRGYTFISRNYNEGDKIFIIGFSRGAYTARALAGLIVSQGLLKKALTVNNEKAYMMAGAAWYQYRQASKKRSILSQLAEISAYFPGFISQKTLKEDDLIKNVNIECVAVFDTVGSMGIPIIDKNETLIDAFKFTDLDLSDKVINGLHAVALDEQRVIFSPTLWNDRLNIKQSLFSGGHADVGGGYASNESGLSDIAYSWMQDELKKLNIIFSNQYLYKVNPNHLGVAHQEWIKSIWTITKISNRKFPKNLLEINPSVYKRVGQLVQDDPRKVEKIYAPKNIP